MTRHARSLISFPVDIDDGYSMLIEMFHNMSDSERSMCLRNLERRYINALDIVREYEPLIPYLQRVHEELKGGAGVER